MCRNEKKLENVDLISENLDIKKILPLRTKTRIFVK